MKASRTFNVEPGNDDPVGHLRVQVLGRFEVAVDGRTVPETAWRQRRAAGIIKLLALEPTHRHHREQLMDALWPDLDYRAQLNNLRQALLHARRALESVGMPCGMALRREGDMVVLAPAGSVSVDAHAFEEAVADTWRALTPASALNALDLYSGDLLPDDRYEEWAEPRRTTLRTSYLTLMSRLATLYEERGEPAEAIGVWQRLVAADPTNEAAHAALIRLYACSGQRQQALEQFDQLVTILERDLDASPDRALWELASAIREGQFPEDGWRVTGAILPGTIQSNVPVPISRLVGRQQDLVELEHLLATERLVTLTGPGGIGKTRLAIEVAHRLTERFPDGVVFVDLAPVHDPNRVIPAIAEAFSVREDGDRPLAASLVTAIRNRCTLLVLDNIEQVVAAGPAITQLLEQVSSLQALVTSRISLRLRGEREYPVQPLEIAEADSPAVRLFVSRARDVQPKFMMTTANAETLANICRRLDGLPLAIELAAARSRILAPQAILDRLNDPLGLLTTGASDLPDRQRTIRATIQWSYDLLDPDEQQTFDRLSLFVGGWTLDAAESLLGDLAQPCDVLDRLDSLAGKNLIARIEHPNGEMRFRMLETIREFGLERLASSGDESAVRDRHAGWVVQLVEQAAPHIEGAEQVRWLARLGRESDNIRAGLRWLLERHHAELALRLVHPLRLHWFGRGRIREGLEQIIAVTDLPESASYPALRADALTDASFLARELGEYQLAHDTARASLAISHQMHDRQRAADALVNLGFIALQRGQIDSARSLAQRSLTTYQDLKNDQGIADSLGFLALMDVQQGDLETAGRRLERCATIWGQLDDLQGVAWANAQLGLVRLDQSDDNGAWHALMTSLALSASIDFRGDIYLVLDGLARLALNHGQPELACGLAAAAALVRKQSGITLAPAEQERAERLLGDLQARLGLEAVQDAWVHRHAWTLESIIQSVTLTLGPLFIERQSSTVTQPGSPD